MITPNSKFIILKSPIELDNLNQLTFENATAQYNYFNSLIKKEYDEVSFVRKDNIVVVETDEDFTYDDLLTYNYCMYQNTSYGDKWFYAFIEDCSYLNDGACELKIKTDVYQTWQFDIEWKQTFIEREHIAKSDDVVGANLIYENLEKGEYVVNSHSIDENNILSNLEYVLGLTFNYLDIEETGTHQRSGNYNGIFSGLKYYGIGTWGGVSAYLDAIDNADKASGIGTIFMAPKWLTTKQGESTAIANSNEPATYNLNQNKLTTINGYTPRNAKLKTFPYCYLIVSNNQGGNISLHYEKFSTSNCQFVVKGALTTGCSIVIIPKNYKGTSINYNESLTLGKFPTCSWTNDVYTNWLTQQSVNIGIKEITSIGALIGGSIMMATGAGALVGGGVALGGLKGIADLMSERYEHSLVPPQASGNINSGDVNTSNSSNTFHFYHMSITNDMAQRIDSYFDMYGYATNKLKLPNLNNRSNWNFVKTINCNILGDIPQKDIEEIKTMFNNGLTLWHNPNTFLDYSQSNN